MDGPTLYVQIQSKKFAVCYAAVSCVVEISQSLVKLFHDDNIFPEHIFLCHTHASIFTHSLFLKQEKKDLGELLLEKDELLKKIPTPRF